MVKQYRRIIALLTALVLVLGLAGCGSEKDDEPRDLEEALEALEDEDFDTVLELVEDDDDLAENRDLIRAVKKHLKNLKSDFEDGERDAGEAEEVLEDMEDLLDALDDEDLLELAEELAELLSGSGETTEPPTANGGTAGEPGVITGVAVIADPYAGHDDPYTQACLEGVRNWCGRNGVWYRSYLPLYATNESMINSIECAIGEGCNAIVMPSYLFGGPISLIQEQYPNIHFIGMEVSAGDLTTDYVNFAEPAPNTACITFAAEQAGFLAGYAAAAEGYGTMGFIGAMEVPAIAAYRNGYYQGIFTAQDELGLRVSFLDTYVNTYSANADAAALAEDWYNRLTDVIFVCGGSLHHSVVEAAEKSGAYVIGFDYDMNDCSSAFLTCAIKDYSAAAEAVLEALHNGSWAVYGGRETVLSLADGDFLGLATDSWNMVNFSREEYELLRDRIAGGEIIIYP